MEQGLGSSTWWEEPEYKQLGTVNDRALFILDKLIKRDITKFQAAWAVAFPGRPMNDPSQIQPEEVTRGPWLVILTRMGATREETTDILDRVGRRWWRGAQRDFAHRTRLIAPFRGLSGAAGGELREPPEVSLADLHEALAFGEALLAGDPNVLILLTGVGTRMPIATLSTRWPREENVVARLGRLTLVCHGRGCSRRGGGGPGRRSRN